MRSLAVIPARYHSNRLPGKPLAKIGGLTMVEHVYRRAREASLVNRVLVATEDERVRKTVVEFGGECVMTSPDHPSGTDRVAEAVAGLDFDLVVNLQGDEPFLDPQAIDQAVAAGRKSGGSAIATLRKLITSAEELWDPNVVKVVTDARGHALYFSRWPIPFVAKPNMSIERLGRLFAEARPPVGGAHYKHIGLYVYPKEILLELTGAGPSPLEKTEKLEQLRALERGVPIRVEVTDHESLSVDTPADLEKARSIASQGKK
jgi:3-deoxy-manno-octulosonate cytidylyltransferase (CMP-KDO synthetase)